ncbi:MAG: crossover junction endodeoxyribonuclease RuvC [Acidobacteriota bacterium]|nr:MAG: crossover junction endodeoxyribonuclease RuvC [Acidobacteriota bacterium]
MSQTSTILGLDPGSRRAGFAWVRFDGSRVVGLEVGAWTVGAQRDRARALSRLMESVEQWLSDHPADVAAVEGLFHHRNVRSALVLAESRGVLLAALGRHGVPVVEYSPAAIKKTICGSGKAAKEQVRRALALTVSGLTSLETDGLPWDATDALAAAVCHHTHASFQRRAVR